MGKRGILCLGLMGFVAGCVWLYRLVTPQAPATPPMVLVDSGAGIQYLERQGVSRPVCIATECVHLPSSIDPVYAPYAALQKAQGFPLAAHLGESAVTYTYVQAGSNRRLALLCGEDGTLYGAMQYDPETAAYTGLDGGV